jgi:hypothetical protein
MKCSLAHFLSAPKTPPSTRMQTSQAGSGPTIEAKTGMKYSTKCSLMHYVSAPKGCIRSDVSRKMPLFNVD